MPIDEPAIFDVLAKYALTTYTFPKKNVYARTEVLARYGLAKDAPDRTNVLAKEVLAKDEMPSKDMLSKTDMLFKTEVLAKVVHAKDVL